jgi:hypothetical protein
MIVVPGSSAKRGAFDAGAHEDERPDRRDELLTVHLEGCAPAQHEVELLVRIRLRLVVLVNDPITGLTSCPGVDTERRDAEVVPHGAHGRAAVV